MKVISAIATHSFREILGTRILYSIIAYAALVMLFAILASQWTIGEEVRFITDMGLGAMLFLGLVLVITRGAVTLSREIEKKTVLVMLARPIHRWQFVVGNFLGMGLVLLLLVFSLLLVLVLILLPMGGAVSWPLLGAAWGVFLELLMISAVALLASNLSSPVLATLITLLVFLAGHMASNLHVWISQAGDLKDLHLPESMLQVAQAYQSGPAHWFLQAAYYLLPNMAHVNFKMNAADAISIPGARLVAGTVYAFVYSIIATWISIAIFGRRDMR